MLDVMCYIFANSTKCQLTGFFLQKNEQILKL